LNIVEIDAKKENPQARVNSTSNTLLFSNSGKKLANGFKRYSMPQL
jgi:hypothetical protein